MCAVTKPLIERRQHARRPASGAITLWWTDCKVREIQGQLLDISESGFRIGHGCAALGPGEQVRFRHAGGEGIARTVWTRILKDSVESGLLILPAAAA